MKFKTTEELGDAICFTIIIGLPAILFIIGWWMCCEI